MKLFRRELPTVKSSLAERAHNVNRAAVLLQEMHLAGTITEENYLILSLAIRSEIDAVAQELRAG